MVFAKRHKIQTNEELSSTAITPFLPLMEKIMLKKNDTLTVTVIDINHEGLGVAKQDGAVIFIKGAVTGDTLLIKIIKVAKNEDWN